MRIIYMYNHSRVSTKFCQVGAGVETCQETRERDGATAAATARVKSIFQLSGGNSEYV